MVNLHFNETLLTILMSSLIICLSILMIKFLSWILNYLYMVIITNKIPGIRMYPFIGNLNKFFKPHSAMLFGIIDCITPFLDKPICRFWIGTQPYISFHKADYLDVVFDTSKHNKKSFEYSFFNEWLGDGLLVSVGEKWHSRRKLITPTFHFDILKDFFHVMNEQCDIMIEEIKKQIKLDENVNLAPFFGSCSLDIISETAMGHNINAQMEKNSEYLHALEKEGMLIMKRSHSPWLWNNFIFNLTPDSDVHKKSLRTLLDFTKKIINDRLEDFQQESFKPTKRKVFLDVLLEAYLNDQSSITLKDINDEVNTFMFEGHDTTSSAIEWACYCIARHSDVQQKIQDELNEIIGTSTRYLTIDDLNKLKYLECVLKEALRLYPAVPMIFREFTENATIGEYKVLKGTTALIFIYQIHRDEKYFPEPEKFIPERFLPEKSENRHSFAYIPFSAGRRNCIGQKFAQLEYKLLVANIFRNFQLKCDQNIDQLIPEVKLILRTENPILFKIKSN